MNSKRMSGLLFGAVFAISFLLPLQSAHAQVPQCNPNEIAGFVPYVYGGELHSFDYFLTAPGTAVKTTVAGIELTPNYTSTWVTGTTSRKMHVDVPGWYDLNGNVPIVVETLSKNGCVSVQTFSLVLPVQITPQPVYSAAVAPIKVQGSAPANMSPVSRETLPVKVDAPMVTNAGETASNTSVLEVEASVALTLSCAPETVGLTWTQPESVSFDQFAVERAAPEKSFERISLLAKSERTFTDTDVSMGSIYNYRVIALKEGSAVISSPSKGCAVPANIAGTPAPEKSADGICGWSSEWWTVFVIALVIASLVTINALPMLLQGNGWRFTLALFVPFAILLSLWFIFDTCRNNQWFPIVVTLITLATLFAPTFLKEHPKKTVN